MNNTNYPLISIIMLNYNGLEYLKRTFKPVLELRYPNYEFIIVDNGSTDGSLDFIKSKKNIKLIKSPRLKEKNFACNFAIKRAKGEYIFLMDNDVLILNKLLLYDLIDFYFQLEKPGFITQSLIDEHSNLSGYYGGFFSYYFIRIKKTIPVEKLIFFHNSVIGFPHGANIFFKKGLWKEIGGYDEDLFYSGDDTEIGIKSIIFGHNNYLFSKYSNIHLGINNNKSNKKFNYKWGYMIHSQLTNIFVNYKLKNLIFGLSGFLIFTILKSLKQAIRRKSAGTLFAFLKGYYLFFRKLPVAIGKRKEIQARRVIKEDIFLKIKPLKIK